MTLILGIDPGSRITGYGIISVTNNTLTHCDHGCIRTPNDSLPERLRLIFTRLSEQIQHHQPDEIAIEQVFMATNAQSALVLGHARGAALTAIAQQGYTCHEYAARQIKQAVAGHGQASKTQIQHMVTQLLKLKTKPPADAADALAIAICHHHHHAVEKRLQHAHIAAGHGA